MEKIIMKILVKKQIDFGKISRLLKKKKEKESNFYAYLLNFCNPFFLPLQQSPVFQNGADSHSFASHIALPTHIHFFSFFQQFLFVCPLSICIRFLLLFPLLFSFTRSPYSFSPYVFTIHFLILTRYSWFSHPLILFSRTLRKKLTYITD